MNTGVEVAQCPMRVDVDGQMKDLGVVCFDVQDAWELTDEDRKLLRLVGVKVAALWTILCGRIEPSPRWQLPAPPP